MVAFYVYSYYILFRLWLLKNHLSAWLYEQNLGGGGGYWQCTMFYAGITSSTNISQGSENELTM